MDEEVLANGTDADDASETESSTAIAETEDSSDENRLQLKVEIDEIGPCKKHVTVTVLREDIDHLRDLAIDELAEEAEVPGFRVGKVPAKLLEKRFRKEILGQLKQKLLVQSMEQVSEDHGLEPIGEPDLEVESLEIPEEGDFEYEFEIEVRPSFELPDFENLKIKRDVSDVTEDDINKQLNDYIHQYGTFAPYDGEASLGDYLILDLQFLNGDQEYREMKEVSVELRPELRFHDAELKEFGELMVGVQAGETRETDVTISLESNEIEMRGETLALRVTVQDIKKIELPEMDDALLDRLGAEDEESLRASIKDSLERQSSYEQRESARNQLLEQITESANWDLPEDLVVRQADNALRREVLEMQQAGFTEQQIAARESRLRQQSKTVTQKSLKQHFVLDRVAEEANIEVPPSKVDSQIQMMAWQQGESPRKVRAKMVKSGMMENLEAQMREQMAVDHILGKVTFIDTPAERPDAERIATIDRPICAEDVVEASAFEDEDSVEEE